MNVRELIERYDDARNAQDVDAIHAHHHPEIVFHNHTADERAEGADAVRAHIARIFEDNPALRFSTRSLEVGDDFAVCEWTASTRKARMGRRRRLPDQGREDRAEGRVLVVASSMRTVSSSTSGRL
jgi:ketosteroid isomerase-like protein